MCHRVQVCAVLLSSLDFQAMPLDSALRRMISLVKLPGEAQKIDRIIEQARRCLWLPSIAFG